LNHTFSFFFGRTLAKRDCPMNLTRFCLEVLTFRNGFSLFMLFLRWHFARSYVQKLTFFSLLNLDCQKNTPSFCSRREEPGCPYWVNSSSLWHSVTTVCGKGDGFRTWKVIVNMWINSSGKPKVGGPPYWALSMELRINVFKRTSLSRNIKHEIYCSYRYD
jgi:hypothetical protein